jgi:hypothetical protein
MTVIDVDLDHLRGGNGIVRLRVSYIEMLNKSTETLALLLILLKSGLGSALQLTQFVNPTRKFSGDQASAHSPQR